MQTRHELPRSSPVRAALIGFAFVAPIISLALALTGSNIFVALA